MDSGDIPDGFLCPITTEVMTDPVVAADGHTYERSSIEKWFATCLAKGGGEPKSPLTNEVLPSAMLIPNHALRKAIAELTARQNGTAPPAAATAVPPPRLVVRPPGGEGKSSSPAPSAPPMDEHFLDDTRGDAAEGKRADILGSGARPPVSRGPSASSLASSASNAADGAAFDPTSVADLILSCGASSLSLDNSGIIRTWLPSETYAAGVDVDGDGRADPDSWACGSWVPGHHDTVTCLAVVGMPNELAAQHATAVAPPDAAAKAGGGASAAADDAGAVEGVVVGEPPAKSAEQIAENTTTFFAQGGPRDCLIATAGRDKQVHLWRLLKPNPGESAEKRTRRWSFGASGRRQRTLQRAATSDHSASGDSGGGGGGGGGALPAQGISMELVQVLEGHSDAVCALHSCTVTRGGGRDGLAVGGGTPVLCSAARDKTVKVWTPLSSDAGGGGGGGGGGGESGSGGGWGCRATLRGHKDFVLACALEAGGMLASGGGDWDVHIWDLHTARGDDDEPVRTFSGHAYAVRCLAWANGPQDAGDYAGFCCGDKGALLASGSDDETVRVWDTRAKGGGRVARLRTGSPVLTCCWGPAGGTAHRGGGGAVGWLAAGGGLPLDSFSAPSENVGGWLRVWDPRTWKPVGDCRNDVLKHRDAAAIESSVAGLRAQKRGSLWEGEAESRKMNRLAEGDVGRDRLAHRQCTTGCYPIQLADGLTGLVSCGDDKDIRVWQIDHAYGKAVREKGYQASIRLVATLAGHATSPEGVLAVPFEFWSTKYAYEI